jgi:hypothetical protein
MLFIIMQQVQPAFIMVHMQSQQAWIMSQHILSPDVHIMVMPSAVISHLHMPMVRLHVIMHMPFIIMVQEHMPPASMVQRFCIIVQATLSSHMQVIFMPPWHFSIFMVQRGTIIQLVAAGAVWPPGVPIAGPPMPMPIVGRSIIIVLAMRILLKTKKSGSAEPLEVQGPLTQ